MSLDYVVASVLGNRHRWRMSVSDIKLFYSWRAHAWPHWHIEVKRCFGTCSVLCIAAPQPWDVLPIAEVWMLCSVCVLCVLFVQDICLACKTLYNGQLQNDIICGCKMISGSNCQHAHANLGLIASKHSHSFVPNQPNHHQVFKMESSWQVKASYLNQYFHV